MSEFWEWLGAALMIGAPLLFLILGLLILAAFAAFGHWILGDDDEDS